MVSLRPLGATVAACLALALSACTSTPITSPTFPLTASPSTSPAASGAPGASSPGASSPDDSAGPLPFSSTVPSFSPPALPSLAPGASTIVLHVPVLMYHRVVPPGQAGASLEALDVPPARFAAQMAALAAAGWHTITAAQLADDLASATAPPPKTFVVTFDDGYDDGYTYAFPILQSHGFVATYFIVPGRVTEPNWTGIVLSEDHIRALAAAGMEIANHTYSHIGLAGKPLAIVEHQVIAASARIERFIGTAPTTFAYPFGAWDRASADVVGAAGMVLAFTTVEGARETWATRLHSPRIRVGPATTAGELVALLRPYQ